MSSLRRRLRVLAALPIIAGGLAWSPTPAPAIEDSIGSEFWLMFNENLGVDQLSLFLTGPTAATGTVEIPGLAFSEAFSVTPGAVTTVEIPASAMVGASDGSEEKGIHVTADGEVTVYGLNQRTATTDAFLGLPTDILTGEYVVLATPNTTFHSSDASQIGIVGTADGTTVTITPSEDSAGHVAGVPFDVALDEGDAYQLQNTGNGVADISGTLISANAPVAVFGGNICTNIPGDTGVEACDHNVEQLFPADSWGQSFVTVPLATRMNGDSFGIVASTDNTEVSVNGTVVATLNRGDVHRQIIDGASTITADQPIMVAQYSNSSEFDGVTSDPFMMLVPPFEQFLGDYTVTTPASGFAINFVNVAAPAAAVGAITLDGVAIPAASFSAIGSSGFSGAQLPIAIGSHTLSGPAAFGVFVYGFDDFDSYGYPGGLALAQVATIASIDVEPETVTEQVGLEHCVNATVLNSDGDPVSGARVDFETTGANPGTGFAFTDASGVAEYCYTGASEGTDTITGVIGALSDTVTVLWTDDVEPAECHGLEATIVGTNDGETINGTPGRDVIAGLGGDDRIIGFRGHDIICGGEGNDIIQGHGGRDWLEGNEGNDLIEGNRGHDRIHGGDGNDVLPGDTGDDVINGGAGNDRMGGNDGEDILNGDDGTDLLNGGNHNDQLNGGNDNDRLMGMDGDDHLDGNAGADAHIGGAGTDSCAVVIAEGDTRRSC